VTATKADTAAGKESEAAANPAVELVEDETPEEQARLLAELQAKDAQAETMAKELAGLKQELRKRKTPSKTDKTGVK
jgi:hypothetical protein